MNCYNCGQILSPLTEPASALVHTHCVNSIFSKRLSHLRGQKRIVEPRTFLVTVATPQPKVPGLDPTGRPSFYRRLDMAARSALHKAEQQAGEDWQCSSAYPSTTPPWRSLSTCSPPDRKD